VDSNFTDLFLIISLRNSTWNIYNVVLTISKYVTTVVALSVYGFDFHRYLMLTCFFKKKQRPEINYFGLKYN